VVATPTAPQTTQPLLARARPPPAAPPRRAIRSGVLNDLGSGSNVDLCIITAAGAEYLRNYEYLQAKTYERVFPVVYLPGTTREYTVGWASALR
jgi:hypothetical protein